jgi:DNA-binding FadR family transcriptional regulator
MAAIKADKMPQRIHVPKTSEIVADKIRAQIVRGELSEGDSLPPEGQLMESLGISRPTLREAFRILEAEGLISVVRGSRSGAKVHKPSVELVSRYAGYVLEAQGTRIDDLYTSRLAIEPTAVRWLATVRGQTEGMQAVHDKLAEMNDLVAQNEFENFINLVPDFHHLLVEASGNRTLSFLNRMILNLQREHQNGLTRRLNSSEEDRRKRLRLSQKSNEKVVRLILEGEVEEAVTHWRLHLTNANNSWISGEEGAKIVNSLGNLS